MTDKNIKRTLEGSLDVRDLDNLNFDDPTDKETEKQQRAVDEELEGFRNEYEFASNYLRQSVNCNTPQDKVNWLKELGYNGIKVSGVSGTVNLDDAERLGYKGNVHAMFKREEKRLIDVRKKAKPFVFGR